MKQNQILHVMILDKFLAPFIDFVDEHFGRENHHYVFITSEKYDYGLTPEHKVEFLHTDDDIFITLLEYMKISKKIILHGLWRDKVDVLLYFNQELLKKCYWNMWGGDFYFPETKSKIKHEIIKNMGYCVTSTRLDLEYIKKHYLAKGSWINSFFYPSNLYKEYKIKPKNNTTINILLGNSATETNNHFAVFNQLTKYKNENINVFVPLSYGDKDYAKLVIARGKEIFADKFIALTEFMPFDKYMEFLSEIDIAIFAQERQQAFGNIIALLSMGKKVYLNPLSPLNEQFEEININLFNIKNFSLYPIEEKESRKNINIIRKRFSKQELINNLKSWMI